ncbi:MAG TPA: flagellar motor switch protein FliN [Pirellulaceae bacterium]|nr:flagellar motor switch protein FliN [Pirellulaceae bacterium]
MADSDKVSQDEIEELLRQAQSAAGISPRIEPFSPAAVPEQNSGEAAPATAAAAATATARAAPPRSSPASGGGDLTGDDIGYLLSQAEQALASVDHPTDPAAQNLSPFQFRDFTGTPASGEKATLELLRDVDLNLRIELGRTQMYLEDVLKLRRGAVVSLDKLAGDPVDIFVNGRLIARGEVLVMNDNFCIRVAELLAGDDVK